MLVPHAPANPSPGCRAEITAGPSGLTASRTAAFEFRARNSSGGGIEGAQCSLGGLDGSRTADDPAEWDWADCSSSAPVAYSGVPDGMYQFTVRLVSGRASSFCQAGRLSPPPLSTPNTSTP